MTKKETAKLVLELVTSDLKRVNWLTNPDTPADTANRILDKYEDQYAEDMSLRSWNATIDKAHRLASRLSYLNG